jgi:hypothetical protein
MANHALITRRTLAASLAAFPAAAVAGPWPIEPNGGAALREIWSRWEAKRNQIDSLPDCTDEEMHRHWDEWGAIEAELRDCPAQTLDGVMMKVHLCEYQLGNFDCGAPDTELAFRAVLSAIKTIAGAAHV